MKRKIFVFLSLLTVVLIACGCKEEIIQKPTVVIDETIGQEDTSEVNSYIDADSNNSNTVTDHNSSNTVVDNDNRGVVDNDSSEAVNLSDPDVILGKWEIVSHLADGKEETPDMKYLVITEDYKFYLTNNLKSLSGDYRYSYEDAVITVTLNNQVDETYAVTMKSGDELTLKYESSTKNYIDTYKKVQ